MRLTIRNNIAPTCHIRHFFVVSLLLAPYSNVTCTVITLFHRWRRSCSSCFLLLEIKPRFSQRFQPDLLLLRGRLHQDLRATQPLNWVESRSGERSSETSKYRSAFSSSRLFLPTHRPWGMPRQDLSISIVLYTKYSHFEQPL